LVASIDSRISLYERATGAMLALGRQSDGWCPSNWILAKDTIAQIFERLGLTSQALSVLDDISAVVDNPDIACLISLKFPSLVRDHCSLNMLESNSIFFRELLRSDQASEADARHYLFFTDLLMLLRFRPDFADFFSSDFSCYCHQNQWTQTPYFHSVGPFNFVTLSLVTLLQVHHLALKTVIRSKLQSFVPSCCFFLGSYFAHSNQY